MSLRYRKFDKVSEACAYADRFGRPCRFISGMSDGEDYRRVGRSAAMMLERPGLEVFVIPAKTVVLIFVQD